MSAHESHHLDLEFLSHFGGINSSAIASVHDVLGVGPTLDAIMSIPAIIEDMRFIIDTLAVAYDAGVYSKERHRRGHPMAKDVPVGAAIGDPSTGFFYPGISQDQELGNNKAHAEVNANELYEELVPPEKRMGGLVLGTTIEPCPSCIEYIDSKPHISIVVFAGPRQGLEDMGVFKPHDAKAEHLVKEHRDAGRFPAELIPFWQRSGQMAGLELFLGIHRESEVVTLEPGFNEVTRYHTYNNAVDQRRNPQTAHPDTRRSSEIEAITEEFRNTLASFVKP